MCKLYSTELYMWLRTMVVCVVCKVIRVSVVHVIANLPAECLVLKKVSGPKRLYSNDICLQVKTVETLRYSRLLTQSSARETYCSGGLPNLRHIDLPLPVDRYRFPRQNFVQHVPGLGLDGQMQVSRTLPVLLYWQQARQARPAVITITWWED